MKLKIALLTLTLALFVQALAAGTITTFPVDATFTGGIYGTWDFGFANAPVGLQLRQIEINLNPDPSTPAKVRFDTVPGGFGSLTSLAVGGYQYPYGDTGLVSAAGATDGGTLLTFQFNNFTTGKAFHFTADVDRDCSSLTGLARGLCQLTAAFVTAQQFSGSQVTYTFGGPGFYTSQFTGTFSPDGTAPVFGSAAQLNASVESVPEPATCIPLAAGLLLIGFRLVRRTSDSAWGSAGPVVR